jgi:hypothetical protein
MFNTVKKLLSILFILSSFFAVAQIPKATSTGNFNRVIIKDSVQFMGVWYKTWGGGGGGISPADTANKWVNSLLERNDSLFYKKGNTLYFYSKTNRD